MKVLPRPRGGVGRFARVGGGGRQEVDGGSSGLARGRRSGGAVLLVVSCRVEGIGHHRERREKRAGIWRGG